MNPVKLITILAIATLISSCEKKEKSPKQPGKKATQKEDINIKNTPGNTKKTAIKSSNPHINAAQSIGEKLQKNADQAKRQLEGTAPR